MQGEGKIVVSNTTPIIALCLIGQFALLHQLYGRVLIPPAVQSEVMAGGDRVGVVELQKADWVQVQPLADPRRANLLIDLDRGETETIARAQELNADLLIIDERLARRHAKCQGLILTGTLGVLLQAKQQGMIDELKPLIYQLSNSGIRLGNTVVQQALQLAGEF